MGLYSFGDIKNITDIKSSGVVQQGFLEKSNVNAVKMMTQLIETNRFSGNVSKSHEYSDG